ncbi:hypothetical protein LIER_39652 [Lithospermum erythrorhizon]|uniref:Uncharacterized protein n=1 Tax=Lithospermum erythrorhizon TaxID=34254 RepID=A0AAV3QI61_LITER
MNPRSSLPSKSDTRETSTKQAKRVREQEAKSYAGPYKLITRLIGPGKQALSKPNAKQSPRLQLKKWGSEVFLDLME